jgi:hypothetical protein
MNQEIFFEKVDFTDWTKTLEEACISSRIKSKSLKISVKDYIKSVVKIYKEFLEDSESIGQGFPNIEDTEVILNNSFELYKIERKDDEERKKIKIQPFISFLKWIYKLIEELKKQNKKIMEKDEKIKELEENINKMNKVIIKLEKIIDDKDIIIKKKNLTIRELQIRNEDLNDEIEKLIRKIIKKTEIIDKIEEKFINLSTDYIKSR